MEWSSPCVAAERVTKTPIRSSIVVQLYIVIDFTGPGKRVAGILAGITAHSVTI